MAASEWFAQPMFLPGDRQVAVQRISVAADKTIEPGARVDCWPDYVRRYWHRCGWIGPSGHAWTRALLAGAAASDEAAASGSASSEAPPKAPPDPIPPKRRGPGRPRKSERRW